MRMWLVNVICGCSLLGCAAVRSQDVKAVEVWRTNADRSQVLAYERFTPSRQDQPAGAESIVIEPGKRYQAVDGFGFALTGGSAQLLQRMTAARRHALLVQIFGRGPEDFGVSYLRVSIGASDMNDHVFTYDDMPEGKTDVALEHFSLREDEADVIPTLREILTISPGCRSWLLHGLRLGG